MAAPVTTTTLATTALAAEYLVDQIGVEAAQRAMVAGYIWFQDNTGKQSMVGHFRNLAPITGVDTGVAEGTALPVLAWSPTAQLISSALEGFSVQCSKVVNSIQPGDLPLIAQQGGTRLARDMDSSLTALFPSLTAGNVGTSGAALTVTHLITAVANLDTAFAYEAGQYYGFLHPRQVGNLRTDIKGTNYGISKIEVVDGKEVMTVEGIEIRKTALVAKTASATDYAGAVFSEQALGMVMAQHPLVEILPIPGQHTFSVDCTVAFGTGVIRPTFGSCVISGINA